MMQMQLMLTRYYVIIVIMLFMYIHFFNQTMHEIHYLKTPKWTITSPAVRTTVRTKLQNINNIIISFRSQSI